MEDTQYTINNGAPQSVLVNGELTLTKLSDATISNLTTLIIGSGVTSIGWQAFKNCTILASVTIGSGVTAIVTDAFRNCINLRYLTIPNSVKSIGDRAFQDCTGLSSLIIPDSVTTIGTQAFKGCNTLTDLKIGSIVQSIGTGAFQGCTKLMSVTIPDSVLNIYSSTFHNCFRLASVTIGSGVQLIDNFAFQSCTALTSVTFGGPTIPVIGTNIFYSIASNNTRKFTFLNTNSGNQINTVLLAQIKSITDDDTVSPAGPQIFILPPGTNISSGPELLVFLTTDVEYCYINNDIMVTGNLINISGIQKTLMNSTNTPITIKQI